MLFIWTILFLLSPNDWVKNTFLPIQINICITLNKRKNYKHEQSFHLFQFIYIWHYMTRFIKPMFLSKATYNTVHLLAANKPNLPKCIQEKYMFSLLLKIKTGGFSDCDGRCVDFLLYWYQLRAHSLFCSQDCKQVSSSSSHKCTHTNIHIFDLVKSHTSY